MRLCDRHADGVYEDLADTLFAYLRHTGVTESKIGQGIEAAPEAAKTTRNTHRPETGAP
ncbi:hypothetical protein [Kitasatospora sp. NBC_01300]|uniref:hypothetical protein n=1 Tax=Kitasatospora sp. NBC_01300 TaxID=2903574 RepID=UPI002F913F42|nr:hypothetical protein OG556_40840 [Kitasatospora sp. NBC_01300]